MGFDLIAAPRSAVGKDKQFSTRRDYRAHLARKAWRLVNEVQSSLGRLPDPATAAVDRANALLTLAKALREAQEVLRIAVDDPLPGKGKGKTFDLERLIGLTPSVPSVPEAKPEASQASGSRPAPGGDQPEVPDEARQVELGPARADRRRAEDDVEPGGGGQAVNL